MHVDHAVFGPCTPNARLTDFNAPTGRRPRHGGERHSARDRRDRARAADPHHRGGLARRAAGTRHVFGRRDPAADGRRDVRGARGVPQDHRQLRRAPRPRRRDERRPRSAQRRAVPRSGSRTHGHHLRDHQRGRREPSRLTSPSATRFAATRRSRAPGRCSSRSAAAARA